MKERTFVRPIEKENSPDIQSDHKYLRMIRNIITICIFLSSRANMGVSLSEEEKLRDVAKVIETEHQQSGSFTLTDNNGIPLGSYDFQHPLPGDNSLLTDAALQRHRRWRWRERRRRV